MYEGREVVWLTEVRTYGLLIRRDTFLSIVAIPRDGEWELHEIENDEYKFWEDAAIGYESDGE